MPKYTEFRYSVRIFCLDHFLVKWYASAASRIFSKIVRLPWARSAFLTNCWVIVEAPWVGPDPNTSDTTARATPWMSKPSFV